MSTIFVTGFPGFLASALVQRLAHRASTSSIICLVQREFRQDAEARVSSDPVMRDKVTLVEGDIVEPALGIPPHHDLRDRIDEVFHLAAVYDLAVDERTASAVNVGGTRNMLALARTCGSLSRFHYMSTCYVSGTHRGDFSEGDLVKGQSFNNHYERSKYLAEVEVQAAMRDGMPATIYRPSVVIGDSQTGETQKYDGPYAFIRWMLRFERMAPVVVVGEPWKYVVNLVPKDFVMESILHLSTLDSGRGRVYHLCDPSPLTVDELLRELGRILDLRILKIRLSRRLAGAALRAVGRASGVEIPPQALDYFVHPTRYRCDATRRVLESSGIRCPPLSEYLPAVVDYVRRHPAAPGAPAGG